MMIARELERPALPNEFVDFGLLLRNSSRLIPITKTLIIYYSLNLIHRSIRKSR
jgi:hypothetical protein